MSTIAPLDGPVPLGFKNLEVPLIQNLGPGTLYLGRDSDTVLTDGIRLPSGTVYEYPSDLVNSGTNLYLQADVDVCDVRTLQVG